MQFVPQPWITWPHRSAFLRKVAELPSLLMLDYDGTLAPFQDDRLQARPYEGVVPRLERLGRSARVHLALVTGRPAHELQRLLPLSFAVEIWGSHGREHIDVRGGYTVSELDEVQQSALDQIEQAATGYGLSTSLERKPTSLALHWREMSPEKQERVRVHMEQWYRDSAREAALQLLHFDGGLEVRSGAVTKGNVMKDMLHRAGPGTPAAYLGDDTTDEDAFAELEGEGISILVRSEVRASAASFWIRPPEELLHFLDAWASAAEGLR